MLKLNINLFRAKLYHRLKSLLIEGDKLDPRTLEFELSRALDMEHKGDTNRNADAINGDIAVSIKTLFLTPKILKNPKNSRDFFTHPEKFLGSKYSKKHDFWTNSIEVLQRRQSLNMDDVNCPAEEVGRATIAGLKKSQEVSHAYYGTSKTYEAFAVHGYNRNGNEYQTSIYIDEYKALNPDTMDWRRTTNGVDGFQMIDGKYTKVMTRLNGNISYQGTCYKEYKNLLKYTNVIHISVPLPPLHVFDEVAVTKEINEYYELKAGLVNSGNNEI